MSGVPDCTFHATKPQRYAKFSRPRSSIFHLGEEEGVAGDGFAGGIVVRTAKIFAKILIMLYFCVVVFKNIVMFKIFEHH